MSASEFRRQQSRVWWSSLHLDEQPSVSVQSPVPQLVGSPQEHVAERSRNSSSSPSTSHKSQDSGFSDSEGSQRAHASPLSSSPETTDGAPAGNTPSPQPAVQSGEPSKRLSQDSALPPVLRRQQSGEEERVRDRKLLLSKTVTEHFPGEPTPTSPLNQTFPLPGRLAESGHRALRSFIKNKQPSKHASKRALLRSSVSEPLSLTQSPTPSSTDSCASPRGTEGDHNNDHLGDLGALGALGGFSPAGQDDAESFLDLTSGPGLPAHTSTPKATPQATPATPFTPSCDQPTVITRFAATNSNRRHHQEVTPRPSRLLDKKKARPVNLLNNFNSQDAVELPAYGPVAAWLGQLRVSYEPECSVALQSKALLGADSKGLSQLGRVQLATPHGLGQLQERARRLSIEYTKLCGRVQRGSAAQSGPLTDSLVERVQEFLQDYGFGVERCVAARLEAACDRLRHQQQQDPADMASALAALRAALTAAVDAILEKQVQELVGVLEGPASPLALRGALSALCALGRQGPALADLVVRCGGVRALLQVVLDARTPHTRRAALRALAAVSCTARAIRSLEQVGGVEVVAELLAESHRSEDERAEAAAVLAQITAPWVPDNARVQGLNAHLEPVVNALTQLIQSASSGEVLLLGAATLAHVSYVEPSAVWPLLAAGAAGELLRAVRAQGPGCSVFLQEQAATLLANMSATPEARAELAQDRAVVALLCFLQLRPSQLQRSADTLAAERVQHKAAIALSRLASDPEVARQVVSLEGVPRLVRLCREQRERNQSDGVLVACLAALRKIVANCGPSVLSEKDQRELVEPRLLDSFMIFSTKQESYV